MVFLTTGLTLVALAETSDGHENLFQPEVGLTPDGIGLLATFNVVTTTDASDAAADGNCVSTLPGGECTLRAAIEEANRFPPVDDDTINLPTGIYNLTLGELLIDSPVTIVGDGAGSTIIDGNAADRVFLIEPTGVVTITGVTIRNGVDTRGAGILNQGTLQLIDSTVFSNATTSSDGGGIRNERLTVRRPVLTVSNSLITGNTGQGGGGIFNEDGTVTINNSTISNNTATVPVAKAASGLGGGIANSAETDDATVTVNDSIITMNTVEGVGGGGISNSADLTHTATVILNRTVVSGNTAMEIGTLNANLGLGGGIRNGFFTTANSTAQATVTLNDSTVSGNDAINGGGIANATTLTAAGLTLEVTVINSTVSGNTTVADNTASVGNGGGLLNVNGTTSLVNSTVSGNEANGTNGTTGGFGGGIFNGDINRATTLWLTNTTISNNTAANDGEGIANIRTTGTPTANFKNSIIAGGCINANGGTLTSHGNNLDDDDTCELTLGSDIPNVNPMLGPLQDNGDDTTPHTETHALQSGSKAIDAGDDAACPTTDQRGEARLSTCDIGSYEFGGGGETVYLPIVMKP